MKAAVLPSRVQRCQRFTAALKAAMHYCFTFSLLSGARQVGGGKCSGQQFSHGCLAQDLAVQISFADGSAGQILYTSKGNPGLPKERVEVHAGGLSAVVDDYRACTIWRGKKSSAGSPGKGHAEEVAALEAQNDELRARLAELEEARQENERLSALVDFAEERKFAHLGARVIQRPVSSWEGVVMIDRGSADGVEAGMPVIAAQGLVGQVAEVSTHSASVRLLTDQQSGVAAMVQSTRSLGIVRGSVSGALSLDFVDREAIPVVGDVILTSGLGGVYPQGVVVGDVSSVDERRGELYPRVVITSRVPVDRLEEVFVLVGSAVATDAGDIE